MIASIRPILRYTRIYFFFFANFAFAALQNVTVDDTVSSGTVVPQYLPSASSWHQGDKCSGCLAQPNSSKAYNGTWHDTTYTPGSGSIQSIRFTFTGSALYIYFILANTVPNANTLTALNFFMDGYSVGSFVHSPTSSTDYQYNVPVYVNKSVPSGQHDMSISPINTGNSVLMLFDYLVYTTDADTGTTSSSTSQPTTSATSGISDSSLGTTPSSASQLQPAVPSSSSESPGTPGMASKRNKTSIIGGVVGGAAALVLVIVFASLSCYQRRKKRRDMHIHLPHRSMMESPVLPASAPPSPIPFEGTPSQITETRSKVMRVQPPSVTNPSSSTFFGDQTHLMAQVELLRDEVYRLHDMHSYSQSHLGSEPQPPPKYES